MNKTKIQEWGWGMACAAVLLGMIGVGCGKSEKSESAPPASATGSAAPAPGVKGIPSSVPPAQRAQYEQQAAHEQARAAARATTQK